MECTMQILEITAQSTRFTRLQRLWEILAAFKGFGKGLLHTSIYALVFQDPAVPHAIYMTYLL